MSAEASQVAASTSQAAPAPASTPSAPVQGSSTHDRLRAFLGSSDGAASPEQGQPKATSAEAGDGQGETLPAAEQVPAKVDQAEAAETDETSGDAQHEEWSPSTLEELAEGLQWESNRLLELPVSVKIDGKEGKAALRDLIKSYQLDGLHHQRLETLNNDRKAFEAKQSEFQQERADKLLRMDAGIKTLERSLLGEFSQVNWQQLAAENPNEYNAKLVSFQQRNAELQSVAQQIAQEQQQHQEQQMAQARAQLEEEKRLLFAKVPEWADEKVRAGEKAEMIGYLNSLGLDGKEAFESIQDHRHMLVARAAWQWHKLQQSKPAVLNKVRTAPKLLKPGSQQSKAASDQLAQTKDIARLKQTGRVADAVRLLKGRI